MRYYFKKILKNSRVGLKHGYALVKCSSSKRLINLVKTSNDYIFSNTVSHYPLALVIEPTNNCNLKCPLCPTGIGNVGRNKGRMSLTLFRSILERNADYIYYVSLYNNGEPFLNKDIYEMVSLCTKRNLLSSISSNLSIPLKKEEMIKLIENRLTYLYVSLDGASLERYKQYRASGDFDLVVANMKKIIDLKQKLGSSYPKIEWQFIVFKHNESEIEKAKQLAGEIGVDNISFVGAITEDMGRYTGEKANNDWAPENKEFRRIEEEKKCRWLWTHGVINWDGGVSPCCWAYYKKDDFGNIKDKDFLVIWNNEKFQKARRIFSEGPDYRSDTVCDTCIKTKNWRKAILKDMGRV
ncbi:MAG: SPASM domain-containing protein [Nitrospirae bacterium]|nr:SPASM domain-containing protein [Nitrospirota bacterium]